MPRLGKAVRSRFAPLGTLGIVLGTATLCAVFVDSRVWAITAAVATMGAVGTVWPLAATQFLKGSVKFQSTRAQEGDTVTAHLNIHNPLPIAAFNLVLRGLSVNLAGDFRLAHVPAQAGTERQWTFDGLGRGEYPVADVHLASSFPFGLWEANREVIAENRLLVRPRTFPVGALPAVAGSRRHEGAVSSGAIGHAGDIVGVRAFREGDSLRRVHWAQTARHDRLIVCETQGTQLPSLEVVVDLNSEHHVGTGMDSTREWAIRIAASLCAGWCDTGALVSLGFGNQWLPAASGSRHRETMLDELARIKPTGNETESLTHLAHRFSGKRPNLRVVIATDLAADAWCHALAAGESRLNATTPLCLIVLETGRWPGNAQSTSVECTLPRGSALIRVTSPSEAAHQVRHGLQEAFRGC